MRNSLEDSSQHLPAQRSRGTQFRSIADICEERGVHREPETLPQIAYKPIQQITPKLQLKQRTAQHRSLIKRNHQYGSTLSQETIAKPEQPTDGMPVWPTLSELHKRTFATPTPERPLNIDNQTDPLPSLLMGTHPLSAMSVLAQTKEGFQVTEQEHITNKGSGDLTWEERPTLPMMVLSGLSKQQGQTPPAMQSEVSGAAGAAGLVGLGNLLGSVLKYVSAFLIQYGFGPGDYGLYTLCFSLVNLVSAIFNLGLDDAVLRYVAIYRGKKQPSALRGVVLFCTTLAGLAGLMGAVLLFMGAPPLVALWVGLHAHHAANQSMLTRATTLLQMMAPVIPLMTMQVMWYAGLRGFKAFKWRVISTNLLQPLFQILLIGLVLLFFHTKNGITLVGAVLVVSTMLNTVLNLVFLSREMKRAVPARPPRYEVREWLTFASLNFLTTIVDTVLDAIDTILLAAFGLPDVQLGQYGAALRVSNFIQLPLLSLSNIFAPTIAELHSKGERQRLETLFQVVTKWSITFSLPLFLIAALFSPFLLALPGKGFADAWPLLIAFAIGSLINAGTGTVGYMLLMTGYQRLSFLNSLVAVAVNISLGILLTPRYGAMGTAISTGLAVCALNIMRVLQVYFLLKMLPWRWDALKPLGAGALSAAVIGAILYLLSRTHLTLTTHLGHAVISAQLILIPVFLALYIWVLTRWKASPEDEIVLRAMRKKFLGRKGKGKGKGKKK